MQFYRENLNLTKLNLVVLLACLIKVILKYTGKPQCVFLSYQVLANHAQYNTNLLVRCGFTVVGKSVYSDPLKTK